MSAGPKFETFPYVPRWLCWLLNRHALVWRYADYMADIAGYRCRCGQRWVDDE